MMRWCAGVPCLHHVKRTAGSSDAIPAKITGVRYHEAPAEYGGRNYRYPVVNEHAVVVDPRTGRIADVIE